MKVIVSLSGPQVLEVEYVEDGSEAVTAEVRQYHRDFQSGFRKNLLNDDGGLTYEVHYPDQEGT